MAVLATVAVLATALLVWRWQAGDTYVAPAPETRADGADPVVAAQTLRRLEAALRDGESGPTGDLAAAPDSRAVLSAAAGNVAEIGLEDIGLRYLSETDSPMTTDGWSAEVEVVWRVAGGDGQNAARAAVEFEFVEGGDRIAGIGGDLVPLWLQGPVEARRGGGAVVVAAAGSDRVAAYHRQARTAVAEIRQRLGRRTNLVVEVPGSPAGLDRSVGAEDGAYDGVAAVTTGADGSVVPGTPLHVFLNPRVYGDLDQLAAQVVMTHEAVHVATDAPLARNVPLWLLEGFADFVALQDTELPLARTAGQVLAQVREEGVPEALPSGVDFDTAGGHLGATYEAAWQVCEVLAERRSDDDVVALYDAVVAGSDLAAELEKRFGWNEAALTRAWQQRLRGLAGSAGG
ncbi:hypothetical protein KUV85_03240 [Nocardioides panacisoli]|uniref:hypothetical protein n=1 Tax=Nocardioides panacisoli TaxID=627624 RepID=UPI001C624CB2|nr:hypothetical protein [Nocardioides panacisoli]QYJ04711.1 hypothetical protein KUV85_03240 [Nocardioides panacisoli]